MSNLNRRDFVKATGAAGAGLSMAGTASALSPDLDTDAGLQEAIVVFREQGDAALLDAFDLPKGRHDYEALPMSWTFLTGDQLGTLAADDRVLHVSDVFELEYYNDETSRAAMHVGVAQDSGFTGEGLDAVVIDSGIDGAHPDFQGRVESNYEYVDEPMGDRSAIWVDVGPGDSDDIGHGTHCAGILAGDGAASEAEPGTPSYRGMAPGARLSAYSVSQTIYLPYAVSAWDHMLARKLDTSDDFDPVVCSNSYGVSRGNRYNPLDPLNVATWKAFEAGVLPVFAAGNDGPDEGTLNRYAKAPHVLGVAAGTTDRAVTGFSSRGWNQGDTLPSKAGGGSLEAIHHDRGALLSNVEDYFDLLNGYRRQVHGGTFSGVLGPAVNAPYGLVNAGGDRASKKLPLADLNADTLEGHLSLTPDNQQMQLSFYAADGTGDPTSGELLARMGEEPVYIHKDISLDLPAGSDVWVVAETKNAAGVQFEFEYQVYDYVSQSLTQAALDDARPLTLYRPGVVTHGNLVMSTIDPHDALAPLDTSSDGASHPLYGRFSGTSMACPAAAGIAVLVIQAAQQYGLTYAGHSAAAGDASAFGPADVIATIEAEATVPGTTAGANYTPANAGPGFVNAMSAVTRASKGDLADFSETTLADDALAAVLKVTGSRTDDGSAFTGGATNQVTVTVDSVQKQEGGQTSDLGGDVTVYDRMPANWGIVGGAATEADESKDGVPASPDGMKTVRLGTASGGKRFDYFVEAPADIAASGRYSFGPAVAVTDVALTEATDEFGGTEDNNVVVGAEQP